MVVRTEKKVLWNYRKSFPKITCIQSFCRILLLVFMVKMLGSGMIWFLWAHCSRPKNGRRAARPCHCRNVTLLLATVASSPISATGVVIGPVRTDCKTFVLRDHGTHSKELTIRVLNKSSTNDTRLAWALVLRIEHGCSIRRYPLPKWAIKRFISQIAKIGLKQPMRNRLLI